MGIEHVSINNRGYEMCNRRYSTFWDVLKITTNREDLTSYSNQAIKLIKDLHDINIFHGDLHENNFVFDIPNHTVYLIVFGFSEFIDRMIDAQVAATETNYDSEKKRQYHTVKQLLEAEINEVSWIFEQHITDSD
jgi:tRNA A-37 threonylcarbamoyl transferase component Bud32